jgi:hypothetical protein
MQLDNSSRSLVLLMFSLLLKISKYIVTCMGGARDENNGLYFG